MKTLTNLKTYILIALGALLIVSCEKSEVEEVQITNENKQEDFMSTTGKSDSIVNDDPSQITLPVLQMHFDKDVSKEEAFAQFDKKVAAYMNTYVPNNKGVSTEWFYKVYTYTGKQTNNETDGTVNSSVHFNTDKGGKYTSYINLNNPGDDREGGWDAYLFRTFISGKAVSWVEAKRAHLRLKGTDGWFVKHFYIFVVPSYQSITATGSSYIISHPDVWLDNTTSSGWDYYHTKSIGTGRLNF